MEKAGIMNLTSNPAKILVVDDDPLHLQLAARTLAIAGFVVRMAANGEDAITRISTERFDAVLTDVRMPRMNGIELLRKIRGCCLQWLPDIIMTGQLEEDIRAAASVWGAAAVLEKPVMRGELIGATTEPWSNQRCLMID